MRLDDFHCDRPVVHPLVKDAPQGFTVGSRGVTAIETCAEGVLVTLFPGGSNEPRKDEEAMTLLVKTPGIGVRAKGQQEKGQQRR